MLSEYESQFPLPYRLELLKRINIRDKDASEIIETVKSDKLFWVLETFSRLKKILIPKRKSKFHHKFHSNIEIY